MTTTAVPSKDPTDFLLNIENLDKFSNSASPTFTNRMGVTKKTLSAIVDAGQMALSVEVFATTAAGLAATASGKHFSVPSTDASEYLILYLNNAGTAVELKRYPAVSRVLALEGIVNSVSMPGTIVNVTDKEGFEVATLYEDGGFRTTNFWLQPSALGFRVVDADGWKVFDAADFAAVMAYVASNGQSPALKKRFLLFGDSITQTGWPDDANFGLGYRANWPDYAQSLLQMASLRNYARSGAAYREYGGQLDWQKISYQINTSIANAETPDIVVISAGTNDGATLLGTYAAAMAKTTLASLDMTLTIEAMRWAFWTIRTAYPAAKCFASLPIQRADVETSDRQPLLDAVTQMAKRYNFVVIDAHNESDIVKDFEVWPAAGRDLTDGLHPGPSGQQKMARLIVSKIKNAFNY